VPEEARCLAPPLRFLPLQRFPTRKSGLYTAWICLVQAPHAFRFSQPLDASVTHPCLLAMFQARSAPGVCPSELSSSRAADLCLQRRYPHDVRNIQTTEQRCTRVTDTKAPATKPQRHTSRSVEVPSPSGFCSTRESATLSRRFRPKLRHVALLGFCPSRALTLC
jgi:hypothetical protein